MQVKDVLTAILLGALIGLLGRLTLPGKQSIGLFSTGLIGFGAALLGGLVARAFNVHDDGMMSIGSLSWSWAKLGIQVGFAVVGVALAQLLTHTRLADNDRPARRPRKRARRSD
ncbi:hypothetical protein GCM10009682_60830 [Luedemannella flava]|uniref:Transglycosylase associated protein n=1 Tax=Luedemannella flava TaxID=349316 RepID=A0ABP4Z098_9ACTN